MDVKGIYQCDSVGPQLRQQLLDTNRNQQHLRHTQKSSLKKKEIREVDEYRTLEFNSAVLMLGQLTRWVVYADFRGGMKLYTGANPHTVWKCFDLVSLYVSSWQSGDTYCSRQSHRGGFEYLSMWADYCHCGSVTTLISKMQSQNFSSAHNEARCGPIHNY